MKRKVKIDFCSKSPKYVKFVIDFDKEEKQEAIKRLNDRLSAIR